MHTPAFMVCRYIRQIMCGIETENLVNDHIIGIVPQVGVNADQDK